MPQATLDAFQAIGDPSRRHILMLLSQDSLSINALVENFDISRPAVSKHIKILESNGFITISDVGRERYCSLKPDGFAELQQWIAFFNNFWKVKMKNLETALNKKNNIK